MLRSLPVLVVGAVSAAVLAVTAATAVATSSQVSAASPLTGKIWVLSSLGGKAPLKDTELTSEFTAKRRVSGSAGCNRYTGTYKVSGSTIRIVPLATTRKACAEPIERQETAFLKALSGARSFAISGGTLTLKSAGGQGLADVQGTDPSAGRDVVGRARLQQREAGRRERARRDEAHRRVRKERQPRRASPAATTTTRPTRRPLRRSRSARSPRPGSTARNRQASRPGEQLPRRARDRCHVSGRGLAARAPHRRRGPRGRAHTGSSASIRCRHVARAADHAPPPLRSTRLPSAPPPS